MSLKLDAADTFLNFICARAKRYFDYKISCNTEVESGVIAVYNDIYCYDEYLKHLEKLSEKFHDEMELFLIEHTSSKVKISFLEYLYTKFDNATIPVYTYIPTSGQELYDAELYLEIILNQTPVLYVDSIIIPKIIKEHGSLHGYHFYREYCINQLHQDFIDSTKGLLKERIKSEKNAIAPLILNEPEIKYKKDLDKDTQSKLFGEEPLSQLNSILKNGEELQAFNWQSKKEFNSGVLVKLLEELLDTHNEREKPFISEITTAEFKHIFRGKTNNKINFIGTAAKSHALYFIYLLVIRYGKVIKEDNWQKRIPNCFTINGEDIPSDEKGMKTISSLLTQIGKHYKVGEKYKAMSIKRKSDMDTIFASVFGLPSRS